MISSGNLRHRCFLQKQAGIQDTESGAIVDSWTNLPTQVWAEILRLPASERVEAGQVYGESLMDIRVRYSDQIYNSRRLLIPKNTDVLFSAITTTNQTAIVVTDSNLVDCTKGVQDTTPKYIRIGTEIMTVTAGFGTTSLTVTRGSFGSDVSTYAAGTAVIRMGVAEIMGIVNTNNIKEEMILKCKEKDG